MDIDVLVAWILSLAFQRFVVFNENPNIPKFQAKILNEMKSIEIVRTNKWNSFQSAPRKFAQFCLEINSKKCSCSRFQLEISRYSVQIHTATDIVEEKKKSVKVSIAFNAMLSSIFEFLACDEWTSYRLIFRFMNNKGKFTEKKIHLMNSKL